MKPIQNNLIYPSDRCTVVTTFDIDGIMIYLNWIISFLLQQNLIFLHVKRETPYTPQLGLVYLS